MGVVKRIQGWRDSRWPIPNTLQALVGLVEPRDPDAYLERKRAERETAPERVARPPEGRRAHAKAGWAERSTTSEIPEIAEDPEVGDELPARAAAGWYRYGRTFYQVGQGPFPGWGFPEPTRPAATHQGMLL